MKRLAIIGAGGHGKVVAEAAELSGWGSIAFFDDAWPELNKQLGWPVLGVMNDCLSAWKTFDGVIVAIGHNQRRLALCELLIAQHAPVVTIIHPSAIVSPRARIGLGSVLLAGAVVNVDATLGLASIVNTAATVDHDCQLGNGVHLSPGVHLGGGVIIGALSWIGIGASIRHQVRVGGHVVVGAGAAVVKDIPDGLTVLGVPATDIRKQSC